MNRRFFVLAPLGLGLAFAAIDGLPSAQAAMTASSGISKDLSQSAPLLVQDRDDWRWNRGRHRGWGRDRDDRRFGDRDDYRGFFDRDDRFRDRDEFGRDRDDSRGDFDQY